MTLFFGNWRGAPRALAVAAVASTILTAMPSVAAERAGINLGTTSFFDGFSGLAPGCTYIQYIGHDKFDAYNGPDGNKLADWQLKSTYFVPQIGCTTNAKLLGGSLGWTVLAPFSGQSTGADTPLESNGFGFGDAVIGPYITFAPVMSAGKPIFSHGIELDIITPTGKFDTNRGVNPGNHYWSAAPLYRATWLFAPGWELTGRFNYIHNFDHSIQGVTRHTGDGMWINFNTSYEIVKNFRLGLNGYWLKQFEEDSVGGVNTSDSKQESLYMGPGFSYTLDPKNIFNFNVYMPVSDTNAFSDGVQVNLQYVHPF